MAIKQSLFCYRNIRGQRYVALQPRMVASVEARQLPKLRAAGIKVRLLKHDIFVPEADLRRACEILDEDNKRAA